ncbi:class I SAM-dependent methyltransferase [Gluconacetobacter sp. 1b LMG 1731]|uniref:Class I SAM-dependent methyltransferase n=1 Tax=Gluconacetobacter dulcium TaxID=2729096 RepID=A0A7W4NTP4_9PROT|nr:class I SAM-dependent methyltransferase [Gluconacetobacter dulcium]MBB2165911.1 class I SAM-dependent methyltransferase [Gluconacetobacter dulcium]MBB2195087.1 class I SAM-dependent methyltransferase [Gluconacetobacter dulcium]
MKTASFTEDWFSRSIPSWDIIFSSMKSPKFFLEIGSHEGRSACYMIAKAKNDIDITCIDIWEDYEVEQRFDNNIDFFISNSKNSININKIKSKSKEYLIKLLSEGHAGKFDFIYVDGSHTSQDVLYDAILALDLLKVGGFLVFDDYLWFDPKYCSNDFNDTPKPAIDAFTNIYRNRLQIIANMPLYQLYAIKIK